MNGLQRLFKKLSIVLILILILGAIIYIATRPKQDPCFNGRKDNGENGIDCGGFCKAACPFPAKPEGVKDIEINWVKALENGRNNYNLIASISNDNKSWGISSTDYEFRYFDANGKSLGVKKGAAYVMPKGVSKDNIFYIIEENINSNTPLAKAEISFSNNIWKRIEAEDNLINLNKDIIATSNTRFVFNDSLKIYAVEGATKNTSKYDFQKIDISAVLLGNDGQPIAAAKTDQNTMVSGDGWGFAILFPNFDEKYKESIAKVDCRAETNVFAANNFMRDYWNKGGE